MVAVEVKPKMAMIGSASVVAPASAHAVSVKSVRMQRRPMAVAWRALSHGPSRAHTCRMGSSNVRPSTGRRLRLDLRLKILAHGGEPFFLVGERAALRWRGRRSGPRAG